MEVADAIASMMHLYVGDDHCGHYGPPTFEPVETFRLAFIGACRLCVDNVTGLTTPRRSGATIREYGTANQ